MDHTVENSGRIFLAAQTDRAGQAWIIGDNRLGAGKGRVVNLGPGKTPVVLVVTNQRIDTVCTGTDIQYARLTGDCTVDAGFRQQIRQVMDIVRAARHRRAEKALGNIPVRHAIKVCQQRFVQCLNGLGIGEVDRRLPRWGGNNKTA